MQYTALLRLKGWMRVMEKKLVKYNYFCMMEKPYMKSNRKRNCEKSQWMSHCYITENDFSALLPKMRKLDGKV